MSNIVVRRNSMKIKYMLLNLLELILFLIHTIFAKYDVVHYLTSTYFALFLIGISPIVFSILNGCAHKTISHFIVSNIVFTLCQLIGLCVYDIIIVGSVSDSFSLFAGPTIVYVSIITVVVSVIKFVKQKYIK